jgi:hypothetical protein
LRVYAKSFNFSIALFQNFIPRFFSYLFHPILIPTYGLLLFYHISPEIYWGTSERFRITLLWLNLTFTGVLPLINVLLLLKFKMVSSIHLPERNERKLPLLSTSIFYFAEYYLLYDKPIPDTLKLILLAATFTVVLVTIVNLFYKISIHMAGIGCLTGLLFVYQYASGINIIYYLAALFLLSGFIAYSRLRMQAHSAAEVYFGFAAGFACPLLFLI